MADDEPEHRGLPLGSVLEGKYRLDAVIGEGGMGVVYRGVHLLLRKEVAIKVLLPELAADREIVSRVVREARTASATGHPNVVLVTDMGWAGKVPFMVMELLEGRSLAELLRAHGRMSLSTAAGVLRQVLDALEVVHAQGVVHRDLKPGNVMVAAGPKGKSVVKVLDFGISKVLRAEADLDTTKSGKIMGTPRHMAPEQALAADIDHRADLHAAGSLLYTLLTAKAPFSGPNTTATLARVLEGSYIPASQHEPSVPTAMDAVIAKALAVKPEDRYPDAASMRAALRPFVDDARGAPAEVDPGHVGPPPVAVDTSLPMRPSAADAFPAAVADLERVVHRPAPYKDPWPTGGRSTASASSPGDASRLELDVPAGWRPGQADKSPISQPPRVKAGGAWWGWYVLLAVILGGGLAAWRFRDRLMPMLDGDAVEGSIGDGETILLLVDTVPADAFVFVDGVQRDERPVEIPRSTGHVRIRVEADGYAPRVLEVQPTRSRRVEIKLDRLRRKKRDSRR